MKFLVAPDSYKGSLTAKEVADSMEKGILKACPQAEVIKVPIADGGEGTVEAIVNARGGKFHQIQVTGSLYKPVMATFGILHDHCTAIIEMAAASGLTIISGEERNPLLTTSYGTGELIKKALDMGCRKLIIGLGGSATNDGGVGMAQALGIRFLDRNRKEIGFGGTHLKDIDYIDLSNLDSRIKVTETIIASDVSIPLCGENGASAIFGPQKGATQKMIEELDEGLQHFAYKIQEQLDIDILNVEGAGAAGGLGAGLMTFLQAEMRSGIQTILDSTKMEELIKKMDVVLTGEGCVDNQTSYGKAPYGIGMLAKKNNKPVICIAGSVSSDIDHIYECGINVIIGATQSPMSLEAAIHNASELVYKATDSIIRAILIGQKYFPHTLSDGGE